MTDVNLGAAVVNLNGIVENDNWSIALTLTSGGVPLDLTGATVVAKAKSRTATYNLTVTVTDAAAGKLTIAQSDAPRYDAIGKWALRINNRTMMAGDVNGSADVLA